jgi:hypothetical protein
MAGSKLASRHLWLVLALAGACSAPLAAGQKTDSSSLEADNAAMLSDTASRVVRGRDIVPPGVVLNLKGKSRSMVWLGSYIVNTSGCIDCHTHPTYSPGGDPFQGQPERVNAEQYMSGGRMFGPAITAANLTPDNAGRPAGLTRDEFVQTLRTGHNPHDPAGEILQVMPWPTFGKMTTRDLYAVYEYLRALPSLPDNPHPGP